jgi:hypothetical protein
MSALRRCIGLRFMPMHRSAMVIRRLFHFHWVGTFTTGDWDSSNQAFTMSAGSNATCSTASSHSCALLPACSCPVGLSTAGKLVAQTPPSSVSRLNRGYDDAPHGAHRTCHFRGIRLLNSLVVVINTSRDYLGSLQGSLPVVAMSVEKLPVPPLIRSAIPGGTNVIYLRQVLVSEEQPAPVATASLAPKQGCCPPWKCGIVPPARRPVEPITIKGALVPLHLRMPPNWGPVMIEQDPTVGGCEAPRALVPVPVLVSKPVTGLVVMAFECPAP